MLKSEMFDAEAIAIIQTRQLRKTLHYAYDRSPFYRDLFDYAHLLPGAIKSLADLAELPTTSLADLFREHARFLCVRHEEVAEQVEAVWCSHAHLKLELTDGDLGRLAYNAQLSLKLAGITEKDTAVLALSLDHAALNGLSQYLGLRRIGSTLMRCGPHPEAVLAALRANPVTVLIAEGPFLDELLQTAGPGALPPVPKILCVGQRLRQADGALTPQASAWAQAFQAKLVPIYLPPAAETALSQCDEGHGYHVHPELMLAEVVDGHGRPLPDGETGEVCLTPFGVSGRPLLRFRTGDFSRLQSGPCACGRATPRLGVITARRRCTFRLGDQEVLPSELQTLVQEDPAIRAHALIADAGAEGADQVAIWIESDQAEALERLRQRLKLRIHAELTLKRAGNAELRTLHPEGKPFGRRLLLDRRPPLA